MTLNQLFELKDDLIGGQLLSCESEKFILGEIATIELDQRLLRIRRSHTHVSLDGRNWKEKKPISLETIVDGISVVNDPEGNYYFHLPYLGEVKVVPKGRPSLMALMK